MEAPQEYTRWKRMRFKRNKVYVAVDERDRPVIEKNKVLIKYQLDQPHQYWVHQQSIYPLDMDAPPTDLEEGKKQAARPESPDALSFASPDMDIPGNAICIYTDGACSGNPGPAGIGVVMEYQQHRKEISQYIGTATNNIAELEAIKAGLESVKNTQLPVVLFTDSNYALGLVEKGWKATKNKQLVDHVRRLTNKFKNLRMVKVKGHAGHPQNERADRLAVNAIQRAGTKKTGDKV